RGARTAVRTAGPTGLRLSTLEDRWNRAVAMTLDAPTSSAELASVIVPSLPADAVVAVETPAVRAFAIEALGATVLAAFSASPAPLSVPGRLSAEGTAAIAWRRGEATALLAVDATRVTLDGEPLLVSPVPITLGWSRSGASASLTIEAA